MNREGADTLAAPHSAPTGPPAPGADASPKRDKTLRRSFAHCHRITKQRARNFYHGLRLTPEPKRSALFAIYAFMRQCDDLADGSAEPHETPAASAQASLSRIEQLRATMQQVIDTPAGEPLPRNADENDALWPAFHHTMHAYPIDPAHLHGMLDGQRADLLRHRFDTFDQLYDYCYKVASTVGLVCLSVWGHDGDAQAAQLAEHRGIAFQLTNILRDIAEDTQRGRIYLPANELARFHVDSADLKAKRTGPNFDRLMRFQVERARQYYQRSAKLEQHITANCRATSWAMTAIYRRLLERIGDEPRRVLSERVRLGRREKLRIAGRAWGRRCLRR